MAYFLKKSKNKKGTYLQIYMSFYDPQRNATAHKSFRSIGYVHELQQKGIDEPLVFFQHEVDVLNKAYQQEKHKESVKEIGEETAEKFLGFFPVKALNDALALKHHLRRLQTAYGFTFDAYDVLASLIYARMVSPCSKSKTFHDVLPKLYEQPDFSIHQMDAALELFSNEYEKIIEIYNHSIHKLYPFDLSCSYFNCTNFYFEIDREDDFRCKGASTENRHEPLVGLGLLLDANQIPIGMKMYPGNATEIPVMQESIHELKSRQQVTGKTIRVADKVLNSAEHILETLREGDAYIFSKSVKNLPPVEKDWVLLKNDYREVFDKKGKLFFRYKECTDSFLYTITMPDGTKRKITLVEKRVASYNPTLAEKQKKEIYKQVDKAATLTLSKAKRSEFGDNAKYVHFQSTDPDGKSTKNKVAVSLNEKAIENSLKTAGYNLIVSSETEMPAQEIYRVYHNLWRIEESFKVMKSDLDASPVYLQKEETIVGHFLISYLAVTLLRILQIKIFKEEFTYLELMDFIKTFKVAKISERKYINLTRTSRFVRDFAKRSHLPLTIYNLKSGELDRMMKFRFSIIF